MKPFMDKDFLLDNDVAKMLYHHYAEEMPIIDYHCHVNPKDIAENRKYKNITEVWLGGDHYKWRAMRSCGLPERVITGDATDYEKFEAFATAMPSLIGNPLYHWSHLELKRYFGYEGVLSPETCEEVWNICNAKLASDDMTVREIIKKSNVVLLCTTDDPADSLEYHIAIRDDETFDVQVLPAFRPDKVMNIDKPGYTDYIAALAKAGNAEITDYASLLSVLESSFLLSLISLSSSFLDLILSSLASSNISFFLLSASFLASSTIFIALSSATPTLASAIRFL